MGRLRPRAVRCAQRRPRGDGALPGAADATQSDALVGDVLAHTAEHGYGLWAVEDAGGFVGFTGLKLSAWSGQEDLEIGWRLARAAWGRGYAQEAASAALAYGLERVPRVVSFTALSNTRSERVMQAIGMHREREFDHPREDVPPRLKRHVLYVAARSDRPARSTTHPTNVHTSATP